MSPADRTRPLLVSTDELLLDEVLRVLAAAGAEPELTGGGLALRRAHRTTPLVLLGIDVVADDEVRALPRRPGTVVVACADPTPEEWAAAVELGAERVVVLPADESWLMRRAADAVGTPVQRGALVVVGGACGGAGASTVAAAVALLAAAAGSGSPGAMLVDADATGGGLDLLLGAEGIDGLRWPDLTELRGRVSGAALLAALPVVDGVGIVAAGRTAVGPLPPEAVTSVVEGGRTAGRTVVVDLPRGLSPDGALVEALLAEADLAVLVVPARVRAVCAARALVDPGNPAAPWSAARLLARRVPGGLPTDALSVALGRPVLAEIGHDRAAAARSERGEPPPLGARTPSGIAARAVLGALPERVPVAA